MNFKKQAQLLLIASAADVPSDCRMVVNMQV